MERVLIPHACLVAILLVAKSSSGTNFVFHYPPNPNAELALQSSSAWRHGGSHTDGSSSDSTSNANSSDDEIDAPESAVDTRKYDPDLDPSDSDRRSKSYVGLQPRRLRDDHEDDDEEDDENVKCEPVGPPWERLFGYHTSFLASLLAPKSSMCRTKFELTIDDLVFLGQPIQIKPDGTWKKKKKKRKGRSQKAADNEQVSTLGDGANAGHEADDENDDVEEDGRDQASEKRDGLTMFHVVFVMNPPELEYYSRVQEMYSCVVKKFTKALTLEQARADYVGRESELIIQLKERASHEEATKFSELWSQILSKSNLANAIADVYSAIASSKIAHVYINDSIDLSLQIPVIQDTPFLPSYIEPQMPGLHLTTANSFGDDEIEQDSMIARHFTLLLLDEKDTIEKEIEKEMAADPANTNSNLLYFVRNLQPTMSFVQMATAYQLPIPEIQVLARHLIYWRRARAIPPLRPRDYYIVSPNADMRKLTAQIPLYAKIFPTLPTLPKMLSSLSGRPIPFNRLIPSRDHRNAYIEILAWLLRHGWVTQLRSFALLKITREIKQRVARERALKQHESDQGSRQAHLATATTLASPTASHGSDDNPVPSATSLPAKQAPSMPSISASATASTVTPQSTTAVPEEEFFEDSFIPEPQQASGIESAWIEMITKDQPNDIAVLFERMVRYLNGQHALEKIEVREGISRKDLRRVLHAMSQYIVIFRHW